jgi:hypothetical protein
MGINHFMGYKRAVYRFLQSGQVSRNRPIFYTKKITKYLHPFYRVAVLKKEAILSLETQKITSVQLTL